MTASRFEELHETLELSHHPFKRSLLYLEWAFKNIDFKDKRVLDVGGGNGIYSYFARFKGASYCLNLEPFGAGSGNISILDDKAFSELSIDIEPVTIQDYQGEAPFDVMILHDSVNHLNEELFEKIHEDQESYDQYSSLIGKLRSLVKSNGQVIVSDCSRVNFYDTLGVRNPFAPSIDWNLHQHPPVIIKLFQENDFELVRLRWSPFKRFNRFGHLISKLGFPASYFLQSHFNMVFRAKNNAVS